MNTVTEEHWSERPPFRTYEEFVKADKQNNYRPSFWRQVRSALPGAVLYGYAERRRRWIVDLYQLGFALRVRVPDAEGYFGRVKDNGQPITGASWCLPWNWRRRYYEHRVLSRRPVR